MADIRTGKNARARHTAPDKARGDNGAKRIALVAIVIALVVGLFAALLTTFPLGPSQEHPQSAEAPETSTTDPNPGNEGTGGTAGSDAGAESEPNGPVRSAPVEDDSPLDASAGAHVTTVTTVSGITITAPEGFAATKSYQTLDAVVREFEDNGARLAFALEDLSSGRGISHNADELFYPASAIKAVYATMALESYGDQAADASADDIEACLVYSDNDAFRVLVETYGYDSYADWMGRFAPEAAHEASFMNYPRISANGMLSCWKETYRFGTSGEPGSSLLTSCLAQTKNSALGGLLRERYDVWAKAGWFYTYEEEGWASPATSDCGVVFSDCGAYAVAIMSDVPGDFDSIMSVADALNAAHGKMCGGSSALLAWEGTELS